MMSVAIKRCVVFSLMMIAGSVQWLSISHLRRSCPVFSSNLPQELTAFRFQLSFFFKQNGNSVFSTILSLQQRRLMYALSLLFILSFLCLSLWLLFFFFFHVRLPFQDLCIIFHNIIPHTVDHSGTILRLLVSSRIWIGNSDRFPQITGICNVQAWIPK